MENEKASEEAPDAHTGRVFTNLVHDKCYTVFDLSDDECDKKIYCCGMANMAVEPPLRTDLTVPYREPVEKISPKLQQLLDLERATHGAINDTSGDH